jgi:hypothetical protein
MNLIVLVIIIILSACYVYYNYFYKKKPINIPENQINIHPPSPEIIRPNNIHYPENNIKEVFINKSNTEEDSTNNLTIDKSSEKDKKTSEKVIDKKTSEKVIDKKTSEKVIDKKTSEKNIVYNDKKNKKNDKEIQIIKK